MPQNTNTMINTQTNTATNDLRHSITCTDADGNPMYIKIRLNDECKNGHQDFAITGSIYEKGKPEIDRYYIAGGCIHEDILKARPDLKIFVDLHLSDYKGTPSYPVSNGFYHLTNGFNNTKPDSPDFKGKFCEYYRITPEQFNTLADSKNKTQYGLRLQNLNILEQWERQAKEATKLLEEMTGKTFVVDSKKTQFDGITLEEIQEEEERQKSGYYTPEAAQTREEAKRQIILDKLAAERDKDINKANEEFEVKKAVLILGGEAALNNCIYYNHSRTLSFNWRGYDRLSDETVNKIMSEIKLPDGVKIENKKS